jgi:thymidine phosphorylase
MVAALGGPTDLVERPEKYLAAAPIVRPILAPRTGSVAKIATRAVGIAVLELGGGRSDPKAAIDPAVGFSDLAELGQAVGPDRPLAIMHARDEASAARAAATLSAAFELADAPAPGAADRPVVRETVEA